MSPVDRLLRGLSRYRFLALALGVGVFIGGLTVVDARLPVLGLVAVIFGFIALSRPEITAPLVFASIMMEEIGRTGISVAGFPLTLSKIAVLSMILAWTVRAVVDGRQLIKLLPITPGMFAVTLSMIFGIAVAGKAGPVQIQTVVSFVLVCLMAHLIERLIPITSLSWLVRIMGIVALGVMVIQFSKSSVETAYDERYAGAFLDPNMWAMTLLLFAPLVFAVYAEEKRWYWLIPLIMFTVLLPANILQSLSRSGLITTVLVTPAIVFISWRRRWIFIVGLAIIPFVIGAFVSADAMVDRYITLVDSDYGEADGSMVQRAELARTAWLLFRENMVLGVGQSHFIESAIARTSGNAHLIAHNTYLNIAAELGFHGIITHAFFFFLVAREGVRAVFRAKTRRLQRLVFGYAAGMLSFALMSATLNTMSFPMAYFVIGLGMVICRATHLSKQQLEEMDLGDGDVPSPSESIAQAA
ncbi:MAG: hypothetical protein ACJAZO_000693 [Myxococcota bacterium]|jgi:hypothetical protein